MEYIEKGNRNINEDELTEFAAVLEEKGVLLMFSTRTNYAHRIKFLRERVVSSKELFGK
jgi:hypothetical protein